MKTTCHTNRKAFTLIELMVVITIIALLAAVSTPAIKNAMKRGQQMQALGNARQIFMALNSYANDSNGIYPSETNLLGQKINTSNDAFRDLLPNYVDNETIFAVPRSKLGSKADNKIKPETEILRPGENHFAYIGGLSTTSNSNWPLIIDGTNGQGRYDSDETQISGTWGGTSTIVVRIDGSASAVPLRGSSSNKFIPRHDDPNADALNVSSYMGENAHLLEPSR